MQMSLGQLVGQSVVACRLTQAEEHGSLLLACCWHSVADAVEAAVNAEAVRRWEGFESCCGTSAAVIRLLLLQVVSAIAEKLVQGPSTSSCLLN